MQNQKNPNNLHHQFIRKPKRKLSPKDKDQKLYNFKCVHSKNPNQKTKEEYSANDKRQNVPKTQSVLVLDLKHQLSFLKDQMAKIVNSKVEQLKNENQFHKMKSRDQYFPSKTQQNQKSISKQLKKVKSKDKLKFSKLRKQQKSILTSPSKKQIQIENISNKDKQIITNANEQCLNDRKKSLDDSTLEQQIKRIKQNNKKKLQDRLSSLFEQENINSSNIKKSLGSNGQLNSSNIKKGLGPNVQQINGDDKGREQLNKVNPSVNLQARIAKLKKQVRQQESQMEIVRVNLKQKGDIILKLQQQIRRCKQEAYQQKVASQGKEMQLLSYIKKVSEMIVGKSEMEQKMRDGEKVEKKLKEQNLKLKQENKRLYEQTIYLDNKLSIKQMQCIKFQKMLKNSQKELEELKEQTNRVIESSKREVEGLRKQMNSNQMNYQEELSKLTKIVEEVKTQRDKSNSFKVNQTNQINQNSQIIQTSPSPYKNLSYQTQSAFVLNFSNQQSVNKPPLKQQSNSLTIPINNSPNPSPRNGSSTLSTFSNSKQKELLNVIKLHQKSIQNYQKDVAFLQSECKNLQYFKLISKKQEILIKQTNQQIINQQLQTLNNKFTKKYSKILGNLNGFAK